jgi:NSS family neurotransmitter:Na+ symporter
MGQAFFSLGVGMAIFVTYGSYMPRTFSLPVAATVVVAGDTVFAVVAGLAIFPGVFAFGVDPAAGPELAFITLPQIFLRMPGGAFVGAVFFFLLSAAALTSMVSLLEVPVSMAMHRLRMSRWRATGLFGTIVFIIGLPSAMSFGALSHIRLGSRGILDAVDAAVSNILLPVGGILIAVFVGWRVRRAETLREADFTDDAAGRGWLWLVRTVVPAAVLAVLLRNIFG